MPYFLIRFSVTCCRLGLLPRRRTFRINSGARGSGKLKKSFLSRAKLFTFQRANSLEEKSRDREKLIVFWSRRQEIRSRSCVFLCWYPPTSALPTSVRGGSHCLRGPRPPPGPSFPGGEKAPSRVASLRTYCHQLCHRRVARQLIQIEVLTLVVYVVGETSRQASKQTENVGTLLCRDLT